MRWIVVTAAFFGAVSVIIGAAARHLGEGLDIDILHTALRYHQIHSAVLLTLGLYALGKPLCMRLLVPAVLFTAGIVLFSGSLYLMVAFDLPALGRVTPLGGVLFILAWGSTAFIKPLRSVSGSV